jgi:hypothetical protein
MSTVVSMKKKERQRILTFCLTFFQSQHHLYTTYLLELF